MTTLGRYAYLPLLLFALLLAACGQSSAPPEPIVATQAPAATAAPERTPDEEAEEPVEEEEAEEGEEANFDGIRAFIEEGMAQGVPGVAVAIVRGNEVLFAEGFGTRNVETGEPVTPETLFHIGSTQKSMTALLVGTLVDEGLFDWDTPIIEFYPDFQLSDPEATESVTMRQLLEMSSGIPDDAEEDFDVYSSSAEDLFDYVAEVGLLGLPGEEYSYSNISSSLAGYLAVLAAGGEFGNLTHDYEKLLHARVLEPIGMTDLFFAVSEARAQPDHSVSHELGDDGEPIVAESYDLDEDPLAPSGILKANVLDMARYISTQLNEGVAPDGTRVISKQALRETWQPNTEIGDGDYALGWQVSEYEGVEIISHEGAYDGFTSVIGFMPKENLGFVLLANSEETESLLADFAYVLVDELMAK